MRARKRKSPDKENGRIVSDFLVSGEVAGMIVGLSPAHLANLRSRGQGPPFRRLGRAIRYVPSELTKWADAHKVTPGQ